MKRTSGFRVLSKSMFIIGLFALFFVSFVGALHYSYASFSYSVYTKGCSASYPSGCGSTSGTISLSFTPSNVGDLVVAIIIMNDGSSNFNPPVPNGFTSYNSACVQAGGNNVVCVSASYWSALSGSNTVTYSWSGLSYSPQYVDMYVYDISAQSSQYTLVASSGNGGNSITSSLGSPIQASNNQMIIGGAGWNGVQENAIFQPSGWHNDGYALSGYQSGVASYQSTGTYSSSASMTESTSQYWAELAVVVGVNTQGGCNIYACQTITYPLTVTNYNCNGGVVGCVTSLSTTTEHYDSTNTALSQTDCTNTAQNNNYGCYVGIFTTYAVETSTAISYSFATSTVTTTQTLYRLNAPDPTKAVFWIFPLIFIGLGEALAFAFVSVGSKTRLPISLDQRTLLLTMLLGAGFGTMIGTGAGIVNFMFPIVFIVLGIIYAWASR